MGLTIHSPRKPTVAEFSTSPLFAGVFPRPRHASCFLPSAEHPMQRRRKHDDEPSVVHGAEGRSGVPGHSVSDGVSRHAVSRSARPQGAGKPALLCAATVGVALTADPVAAAARNADLAWVRQNATASWGGVRHSSAATSIVSVSRSSGRFAAAVVPEEGGLVRPAGQMTGRHEERIPPSCVLPRLIATIVPAIQHAPPRGHQSSPGSGAAARRRGGRTRRPLADRRSERE
jgi:hypothetical protein